MRLLSLNIEGRKHLDRWIPAFRALDPDIVALQEVFSVDLPRIKRELGMEGAFATQLNLETAGLGEWGIALLSPYPLSDVRVDYYYHSPTMNQFTDPNDASRAVILATVEKNGDPYRVGTVHFTWSPDGVNSPEQERDLNELLKLLSSERELILCGDFNIPRQTRLFQVLARLHRSWLPEHYQTSLDPELFRVRGVDVVVDHLLTRGALECSNVKLLSGLSDHQAILVEEIVRSSSENINRAAVGYL